MNFKTNGGLKLGKAYIKISDFARDPDKAYIIEIKVAKEKRSLNQNDYYWAVVIPTFMKWTGYSKEESHQYLKAEFLGYSKEVIFRKEIPHQKQFTKSTTELNTKEMEDYLESCRHFIYMEFNDTVPKPNELTEEQLSELEKLNRY